MKSFCRVSGVVSMLMVIGLSQTANGQGSGVFVGNGGDGYLLQNSVYVRDLYEGSLHLKPHFGSRTSEKLQVAIEQTPLRDFGLSLWLNRKLSDAEALEPGFGFLLLAASKQYSWVFTDQALVKLPNDAPILDMNEDHRVQIANRDLNTIRISRKYWQKLSDQHKVALILHETIYSLLRPECVSAHKCDYKIQRARLAREIVRALFESENLSNLKPWMKRAMGLYFPIENPIQTKSVIYQTEYGPQIAIALDQLAGTETLGTEEFVKHLYRRYLRRESDEAGLRYWSNQLDRKVIDREGVLSAFLDCGEFQKLLLL